MKRQERERFLSGRRLGVLVTIAPDGRPSPTPVWYRYRDGVLYARTSGDAAKVANLRRDPRVSVSVHGEQAPYRGVIVHGRAEILDDQRWLAEELPRHYLGFVGGLGYRRTARAAIESSGPPVTIAVRPERYVTFDYTPETPLVGRLWLLLRRVLPPWV